MPQLPDPNKNPRLVQWPLLEKGKDATQQKPGIHLLKVHKIENFFGFDFEFCTISLLVMSKY